MSRYARIARKIHMIADALDPQEPMPAPVKEEGEEGGGEFQKLLRKYYSTLNRVKNRPELGKLKFLMDNYRVRKNDVILAKIIDDAPGKQIDVREFFTTLRWLMKTRSHMPAVRFIRRLLDYSLEYGIMKLISILKNKRIRMIFGRGPKEKEGSFHEATFGSYVENMMMHSGWSKMEEDFNGALLTAKGIFRSWQKAPATELDDIIEGEKELKEFLINKINKTKFAL